MPEGPIGSFMADAGVAGGPPPTVEITYCWALAGAKAAVLNSSSLNAARTDLILRPARRSAVDSSSHQARLAARPCSPSSRTPCWRCSGEDLCHDGSLI